MTLDKLTMVRNSLIGSGALFGLSSYAEATMISEMENPPEQPFVPSETVSVIIKNLNEENYVAECLESLLGQSVIQRHPEYFEIVFVDGGSTDSSVEIAKQYGVKVVITRKGILHQLNEGIANSTGSILVFTDSDSYYPPYWLEKLLIGFDEDVSMVHTPFLMNDYPNKLESLGNMFRWLIWRANGGGRGIRREVFDAYGLFDETKDCVYYNSVYKEEEVDIVEKSMTLGRVVYQWKNAFVTPRRRQNLQAIIHECVRNPKNSNCKYAQDLGKERM